MRKSPPTRCADPSKPGMTGQPPAAASWLALHRRSGRAELGGTLVALARLAAAADRHHALSRPAAGEDRP